MFERQHSFDTAAAAAASAFSRLGETFQRRLRTRNDTGGNELRFLFCLSRLVFTSFRFHHVRRLCAVLVSNLRAPVATGVTESVVVHAHPGRRSCRSRTL